MLLGRIVGWLLVVVAVLMASAEAVLALETGTYSGLIAGDLWTLVAGRAPPEAETASTWWEFAAGRAMDSPAWVLIGLSGAVVMYACRARRRTFRFRPRGTR